MNDRRDLHTQRQWEGKFFRCQAQCWYCRISLVLAGHEPNRATKDHLTPLSRGGSDEIGNIVPACIDCNRAKGEMTESEFRTARAHITARFSLAGLPTVEKKQNDSERNELLKALENERGNIAWWRHA